MNWFEGDIGEAINDSKLKNLIFHVYAYDSNSSEMSELWNKEAVSQLCKENCVSIRLEAGTQICDQFKAIYAINQFPTTYFIGANGLPLVVVSGSVDEEELLNKTNEAIELFKSSAQSKNDTQTNNDASSSAHASNISADNAEKKSLDERVNQAKEKLRQIQEKKRQEQEEKERDGEMERRKTGQEIQRMKKEREEQELRELAEKRRREKLDDELAKKRVLERIQQDREEKQKKYAQEKEETERQKEAERVKLEQQRQQEKQAELAKISNIARLQFRFTDGSSTVNQFTPDQTLLDARKFVEQKLIEMNQPTSFSLHSSFPKREYTTMDLPLTLRELGLAPSASLLVIPSQTRAQKKLSNLIPSGSSSSSGGVVSIASDITSFLLLPFTIIYGIIMSLFRGTGNNSSDDNRDLRSHYQPSTQNVQRSQPESLASLRRRNLDRSSNGNDDDNATWNGNSTQQM